jgi:hypothetical protein
MWQLSYLRRGRKEARSKRLGCNVKRYSIAANLISEIDSPEELAEHMFYHGTYYGGNAPKVKVEDREKVTQEEKNIVGGRHFLHQSRR